MAFNNLGTLTFLLPGQSAFWTYFRDGGKDYGVQMAAPRLPNFGSPRHIASEQGKERSASGFITYSVKITNTGSIASFHNLQGGGVV